MGEAMRVNARGMTMIALAALCIMAAWPSASDAMSKRGIQRTFPALWETVEQDPLAPGFSFAARDDSPSPYAITPKGTRGVMLVANEPVRDAQGDLYDQRPSLVVRSTTYGSVAAPAGAADWGTLTLPLRQSDGAVHIGSSTFDQVSIKLSGRRPTQMELGEGWGLAQGVRPGVDQLFVVMPREIEEWLIVKNRKSLKAFSYRVKLPSHSKLRQVDPNTILLERKGVAILQIDAPEAIDADGETHGVSLMLKKKNRLTLKVTSERTINFPIAIDPSYKRLGNKSAYHNKDGFYLLSFCGEHANDLEDFHPTTAPEEDVDTITGCTQGGTSKTLAWDTPSGFSRLTDSANGIGIRVSGTGSGKANVTINARDGVGIIDSNFRGHMDVPVNPRGNPDDTHVTCELRHDPLKEAFQRTRRDPQGPNHNRFFAGDPGGAGTDAFATFPILPGYRNITTHLNEGDEFSSSHMRGFVGMRTEFAGDGHPNWRLRSNQMTWVRLTMEADGSQDGATECSADGLWTMVLYDHHDPTAKKANIDSSRWYADTDIDAINTRFRNDPAYSFDVTDDETGVRRVEMLIDKDKDDPASGVEVTCNAETEELAQVDETVDGTPCRTHAAREVSSDFPRNRLRSSAGRHRFRWRAVDYTLRTGVSSLKPAMTATVPSRPAAHQEGWYWVDEHDPNCRGVGHANVSGTRYTVTVSYEDQGFGHVPAFGSGVQSVRLTARALTDNGLHPTVHDLGTFTANADGSPMTTSTLDLLAVARQANAAGQIRVSAVVTDNVGKTSKDLCEDTITAKPPAPTVTAVRGAGGVVATWADLDDTRVTGYQWACDANLDGTEDSPYQSPYTNDSGATYFTALCPGEPGDTRRVLVRSVNTDSDAPGLVSTIAQAQTTVDNRPVVTFVDNEAGFPIYDIAANTPTSHWPDHDDPNPRNPAIVVDVTDAEGVNDLYGPNVDNARINYAVTNLPGLTAPFAPYTEQNDDSSQVVLTLNDPNAANPLPDASAQLVITFNGRNAAGDPNPLSASLQNAPEAPPSTDPAAPGGVPSTGGPTVGDTCTEGDADLIQVNHWELDCTGIWDAATGNTVRLTLRLRALANTTDGPFATPDQRYDLHGWARDRRQEADNRYLSSVPPTPTPPPNPEPDEPWRYAHTTDLDDLVTDRLHPQVDWVAPDFEAGDQAVTLNNDDSMTVTFDLDDPTPTAVPPATSPTTIDETGLAFVGDLRIVELNASGATWVEGDTVTLTTATCAPAATRTAPITGDIRCTLTGDPDLENSVLNYRAYVHVADTAGNHRTYSVDFMIDDTDGGCTDGDANFAGQYPHIEPHIPPGQGGAQTPVIASTGIVPAPTVIEWHANNLHLQNGTTWHGEVVFDTAAGAETGGLSVDTRDLNAGGNPTSGPEAPVAHEMQCTTKQRDDNGDVYVQTITTKYARIVLNGTASEGFVEITLRMDDPGATSNQFPGEVTRIRVWRRATANEPFVGTPLPTPDATINGGAHQMTCHVQCDRIATPDP